MKYLFMGLIRVYQWTVSPLLGPRCKYWPSCSRYGYEAFSRHGTVRGAWLTAWRILRCNPFSHGGVDPVPPARRRRWAGRFGRSDSEVERSGPTPASTVPIDLPPALAGSARPQGAAE
ncbi:MAG: membrane protein insertion efficiency factor YidD [Sporichthyaceae bacterium]